MSITAPPPKPRAEPNRIKFTQVVCAKLPLPADDHELYWDTSLPGFGLRISSKGRRSWVTMYRVDGKLVVETIGTMALIPSLAEARDRARASMHKARQGVHPVQERKQVQAAEQKAATEAAYTLSKLIEDFIRKHHRNSRPATIYEVRRLCRRALPYLGTLPVKQITKAHILAAINDLSETRINRWRGNDGPALVEASGVLRHLRSMFRWAVDQDLIERDPTQGVRDPAGPKGARERERVLSEDEIKALWGVCDEIGYPFGPLIQLLLLTAAREREVGDMIWSEIKLEKQVWSLPSARAKNHRAHDTHLSGLAIEVINKIPRFADERNYVFSVTGEKPVEAYSDAKRRIDQRLAEMLGEVEPWVFHDLRRTTITFMAQMGVLPHVADRIANHRTGVVSGIAGIYNKFQYHDGRREALDQWGDHVARLVGANIVALRVGGET